MRTRIRRGLTAAALATSAMLGVAALPGTAQADQVWTITSVSTAHCRAYLQADYNGSNYARADGIELVGGSNCIVWLERSTNGGSSWYRVSGLHWVDMGSLYPFIGGNLTGWYWDSGSYQARACISESVQAPEDFKHCTWGW
jgi:hypothetical protein